jgi:hypothetical protein
MTSAPILPNYLGLPFRILVSPFVNFDPENRVTDIMMFNSRNLGALIVDEDPHVKSWEDGQYNIQNMSIEETYGFGILNEGQAIAVAKNVKIRPNEFVMPARSVFNLSEANNTFTDLSSAAIFDAANPINVNNQVSSSCGAASASRAGVGPGRSHAQPPPGDRPLHAPFRPFFEVTGVCSDADDSGLVIAVAGVCG